MNFGFVHHSFKTTDEIEHVKITYFIPFNRERQACYGGLSWQTAGTKSNAGKTTEKLVGTM